MHLINSVCPISFSIGTNDEGVAQCMGHSETVESQAVVGTSMLN